MHSLSLIRRAVRRSWREMEQVASGLRVRQLATRALEESHGERGSFVIFDVGANIGQTTVYLNRLLRGIWDPVIHAFEPFDSNFRALREATSKMPNVHPHQLALGDAASEMIVPLAPHSQWHSIPNREAYERANCQLEKIRVGTLDDFCLEHSIERITLLKTDTEGYDREVLRGGRQMLQRQAVDIICCEVGFDRMDRQHTCFAGVYELLTEYGYKLHRVEDQVVSLGSEKLPALLYANAWFVRP